MDVDKKRILIIFLAIIFLGTFLRFYKLGNNSFVADEFLDVNTSYGYLKTGEWRAWDFNLEQPAERVNVASDERAWMYRWQVAQLFKFFPPTEAVARSISALWGIITIILIYFVAKYFTGKKEIGLIAAFLFSVSVSGLIFDRKLRMYSMFFPVFLAFSWMIFRFFEENYEGKIKLIKKVNDAWGLNLIYVIPVMFLGLLGLHLHQLTASVAIIFGVYIITRFVAIYRKEKKYLNKYAVCLFLGIAAFTAGNLFFSGTMRWLYGTLKFFQNNYSYFSKVFVDYSHPVMALVFFALGIYFICRIQKKEKEATWLAVSFIVTLFMAVFLWRRNAGPQYIFFIQSFEIIIIAAGVYFTAEFFRDRLPQYKSRAFYVPLVLSLLILPNFGYFFQGNNTYNQTSEGENPNYRKIFSYFKKRRSSQDVLITRNFRNYYWSGEKIKVYSFGGELAEEKFAFEDLQKIIIHHLNGWFIISENDDAYVSNDAMKYIEKNFEKISNPQVRGDVIVYRWGIEKE